MASASTPPSNDHTITFFGTVPTTWDDLTPNQKESCIALVELTRPVEEYHAWAAVGELARQWNRIGYEEYSAVIHHTKLHTGKSGVSREKIASHELRLLSKTLSRDSAIPFVIITSKSIKKAREIVSRLEKHPRLYKFGFSLMARQGELRFTAGVPSSTTPSLNSQQDSLIPSNKIRVRGESNDCSSSDEPITPVISLYSLCGARIAVYKYEGGIRGRKLNVATIGGVFQVGTKYMALTVAHVFFDNVTSSGSWVDSGLYVTTDSSDSAAQDRPRPVVSELYEIVVESLWPHAIATNDNTQTKSIGLFEPQVTRHRKESRTVNTSDLIWNFDMDWALIELQDPLMYRSNTLQVSPSLHLELKPPAPDQEPPTGQVFAAAGVSSAVNGKSLGTIGGIMLPWSSHETVAWSFEAEIAVGDSGAAVICPDDGVTYGFIVAHESETLITYFVPALAIFESILAQCRLSDFTLEDLFSLTPIVERLETIAEAPLVNIKRPIGRPIFQEFMKLLEESTLVNAGEKQYILGKRLQQLLLQKPDGDTSRLDLLLDSIYLESITLPIKSENISSGSQKSLLVFSILLELGHGHLIDQFQRYYLTDTRLPFDIQELSRALSKMRAKDADKLAQDFSKRQWAYCPMIYEYGVSLTCLPQTVFPIHHMRRINDKGGTAKLWQIEVLEEFVGPKLREVASLASYLGSSDNLGLRYRFAVKSYKSSSRKLFDNEIQAFRALDNTQGMIRYLGDYGVEYEDSGPSYNILLEYGDLDLEEYFATKLPPVLPTDIVSFWRNILDLAKAVSNIHQFTIRRGGIERGYSGWHADIKPDNILIVQGRFKLADPGFSQFEQSGKDVTEIFGGTITYGPPELSVKRCTPPRVSQAIDIWSLGCVISEAVTWIVLGYKGIKKYQASRIKSRSTVIDFELQPSLQIRDAFHDGNGVLQSVLDWHKLLRDCKRISDSATDSVLDLLDHGVLLGDPDQRINIRELCEKLDGIINTAVSVPPNYTSDVYRLLHDGTDDNNISRSWNLEAGNISSPYPAFDKTIGLLDKGIPQIAIDAPAVKGKARVGSISPADPIKDTPTLASVFQASLQQTVSQAQEEVKNILRKKTFKALLKGQKSNQPKDELLARYIHNRDIIFLVDNGESMGEHWTEVEAVLTTLIMKLNGIDEDGIDILFTTGSIEIRNETKIRRVQAVLQKEDVKPRPGVHTDMNVSLSNILSSYLKNLRRGPKLWSKSAAQFDRGFTLIALTDGIWRGMRKTDLISDTISKLTKSLHELQGHSLEQRLVSIEFIQFGDDQNARKRLEFLDNSLAQSENLPNIIDTTLASGNIYKMLLGSFVSEFDDEDPL